MLTGKTFFPQLITEPFHSGLVVVFVAAAVMMLIGAVASLFNPGRYGTDRAPTTPRDDDASAGQLHHDGCVIAGRDGALLAGAPFVLDDLGVRDPRSASAGEPRMKSMRMPRFFGNRSWV